MTYEKELNDQDLDNVSGGSHPAPGQDPNSPNDGVGSAKDKNQGSDTTSW